MIAAARQRTSPCLEFAQVPGGDRGHDREQRGPGRLMLLEPEPEEHRNEQEPAADPEHPGEDAGETADHDGDRVGHETTSQAATPTSRTAKRYDTSLSWSLRWSAVPPIAPSAAGMPTSAA